MKRLLALWAVVLITSACATDKLDPEDQIYFPLADYMEVWALKLDSLAVSKTITVNGNRDGIDRIMREKDWLEDFKFFIDADINKPSLKDAYNTTRSKEYLIHELKEGEKGKVKKIVIKYEDENVIKEISFHTESSNPFFETTTRGAIFNRSISGDMDTYVIQKYQKIPFMKPNKMIVRGTIRYNF